MNKQLLAGEEIEALTKHDIGSIFDQVKQTQTNLQMSFVKTLCYLSLFCKKDRDLRRQAKVVGDFEDHLDIRNFVGVHKKLSLALWLFFTEK